MAGDIVCKEQKHTMIDGERETRHDSHIFPSILLLAPLSLDGQNQNNLSNQQKELKVKMHSIFFVPRSIKREHKIQYQMFDNKNTRSNIHYTILGQRAILLAIIESLRLLHQLVLRSAFSRRINIIFQQFHFFTAKNRD